MEEKQKKPFWKKWWVWAIVVLVVIGIANSGDKTTVPTAQNSNMTTENQTVTEKKPDLEVVESKLVSDALYGKVTGTIKNNTNRKYGYAQVEINLYDDSDTQIGSTLTNINNFEPGASWKFEAPILKQGATKYKIVKVTGF